MPKTIPATIEPISRTALQRPSAISKATACQYCSSTAGRLRDDGGLLDMRALWRRQIAGIGQSGTGYADFRTNSIAIEIESAAGIARGEVEARLVKVQSNEPA